MHDRRVYVVGAYLPNGGTHMAYHLGRILERDFGFAATAVRVAEESPDHGIHDYDLRMPQVSIAQMERALRDQDVLIVNPSFSHYQFGLRLPGFKLSYVQGFNTFALLDLNLDHFVAVSDFVAAFLRSTYAVQARVIPAFIDADDVPAAPDWERRPANVVLPYRKGLPEVWNATYARLREIVAQRAPEIAFDEPLAGTGIPHRELLTRLGSTRYLLSLSAAEGFGLVPLEAMAMGTLVCGYDGFGGRQYLRSGENCAVAQYPQIERVAERLIDAVRDAKRSAQIAQRGRETAQQYSYEVFRRAWIEEFRQVLRIAPAV